MYPQWLLACLSDCFVTLSLAMLLTGGSKGFACSIDRSEPFELATIPYSLKL
ncbi:uncharacterized protein BO88DRAFT_400576 [Aspergillus vadensis CBS 113365]|uniref:Uncharacterized protein n=1 Tax=Aspergillus vadensis (strain CBS 113365 / IMI 142717 / IBT 24658) TaxID=1448311 RepID=A0A319BR43_ASPVC|nr:hypothetical protein BO88DRAFT_400576 [Aspergillus vadensis CBS 113365]PYH74927.1 hypothetical protein BO88DRAFT_400576 [Aspergillus vadensis CBS 113365]